MKVYKEVWRIVVGQRTMHAPSIEALGVLTSMRLLVDVRLYQISKLANSQANQLQNSC